MSNIFTKILVYIICLFNFLSVNIYSQETHSYNIEAELDIERNIIEVTQSIKFKNISSNNLSEIYLEDWGNSYINNESNLASRITDEYDRSFSFASKTEEDIPILKRFKLTL